MSAEVRIVKEVSQAIPYADEWRSLAAASRAGMFVSPDWFFSWMAVAHDRCDPLLLLCVDGDRLVGVMPLVQDRSWPRAVRFAGDVSVDRTTILSAPDHPEAQRLLMDRGLSLARSVLVVTHLDDEQPLPVGGGTGILRGQAHRLSWASLDGGWSAYLTRRSRNFRADLKRKERTLTEGHEIAYRRTLSSAELESDLDTFFLLHDDRWTDRGGSSSSSPRSRAFLRELASKTLASGALRLWQLTADGRPIAALYAWSFGDTYSYYLAGFDRGYSRHSPGTLLLAHTLREAANEGKLRYDFLLGNEDYKVRFADDIATVSTLVLSDRRIAPAYILARTEASARAVLRRLPSGPRSTLQRGAARLGARLPLTRAR